jgi:NADP-dependent aldehyde dehydrogenase
MTSTTSELNGQQLIAGNSAAAGKATFQAANPTTGQTLTPAFHEATADEVDQAMQQAACAFDGLRQTSAEQRAALLESIAEQIEQLGDDLLDRCHAETALPMKRLQGERGRTTNQTRLIAQMVRDGSWVRATIDRPDPSREPMPKPDVRKMLMPVGPVAVFGASNFPLAISVAGTDTVSALAAGCPVVAKAHPGHPGTSELIGRAISEAVRQNNLPEGSFSLVQGTSHEVGLALVQHEATEAVAFTGSQKAGRALFDAAAKRERPIPVYAEMGSTNPVFLLPGALKEKADQIAQGYINSVTLGVGQFCTNPGLVFGQSGEALDQFVNAVTEQAKAAAPATMLHQGIYDAFTEGVQRLAKTEGVTKVGEAESGDGLQAACSIFATDLATLKKQSHLFDEVFGPASIVVRCDQQQDLRQTAEALQGHLSATIHGTEQDLADYADLVAALQKKVGRLVFNGFPTGIEVCHAMHHGGPYPATTDAHFTSIGTGAIERFVRPVCFQNFPDAALPPELRSTNECSIWRLIDGEMTKDNV